MNDVGRITALRLKEGYETRGQLAEAIGVSRWAIEHWECGRRPIPALGEKLLKCLMTAKLAEQKLGLKL